MALQFARAALTGTSRKPRCVQAVRTLGAVGSVVCTVLLVSGGALGSGCKPTEKPGTRADPTGNADAATVSGSTGVGASEGLSKQELKARAKATEADLRKQLEDLDERLGRSPTDSEALYQRGLLKGKLRLYVPLEKKLELDAGALEDFEQAHGAAGKHGHPLAMIAAGRVYLRRYQIAEAEPYIRRAAALAPENVEVRAELARAESLATGDWKIAERTLEKLVREPAGQKSRGAWHVLGFAYHRLGKHGKAEEAYRHSLALEPDALQTWTNIGLSLAAQGKAKQAIEAHERVLAVDPMNLFATNNLGVALLDRDDPEHAQRAVEVLGSLVERAPSFPAAWSNLGNAYLALRNHERAIEAYETAIGLVPAYTDAYLNMGLAFREWGKLDEAIATYRKALEVAPGDPRALYNFGIACAMAKHHEEAEHTFRRLTKLTPEDSRAWDSLGTTILQTVQEGLDIAPQGAAADPSRSTADLRQASLTPPARERLRQAVQYFEKALELDRGSEFALKHLADAGVLQGDAPRALKAANVVIAELPSRSHPYAMRAIIHFHLRDFVHAVADCDTAIKYGDQTALVYMKRAVARIAMNVLPEAVDDLRKAAALDPTGGYPHLNLWLAHARRGDIEAARSAARAGADLASAQPWLPVLLRYLAGTVTLEDVLKEATDTNRQCEAYFYIAERDRLERGADAARPWYQRCVATGVAHFWEYRLALLTLQESGRVEP